MISDPAPIIDLFRGNFATELLTAAVAHLGVFDRLTNGPRVESEIAEEIGLARRPATVLFTALRAMKLIEADSQQRLKLSTLAQEHLVRGKPMFMGDYIGMASQSPGVVEMVKRLRTNRPAGADDDQPSGGEEKGTAFIFREGTESAMDHEDSARRLTLGLAGRARNVAPVLAERCPLPHSRCLLDVGGGSGIYSIEMVRKNPTLRAVIWDRAEVLKVVREFAVEAKVSDRIDFTAGDMFADPVPAGCDVVLLSNVLHDWDEPECHALIRRCAAMLPKGGKLLIHDVFLNDALDGPLPIALYSAALFGQTEGRAYSGAEYRAMLEGAGLTPGQVVPTLVHCGVMVGSK